MDCPKCGKENRAGAGFCAWCGADMAQEETLAESPEDQGQQASSEPMVVPAHEVTVNQDNEPPAVTIDISEVNPVEQLPTQAPVAELTPTDSASSEANVNTLQVGDTLLDRYVIMELVQDGSDHRLYRAQDLNCCAVCGSTGNSSEDTYCQNCGADLREPCLITLEEHVHLKPVGYEIEFTERDRDYYVLQRETPEPKTESAGAVHLRWGLATDKGITRDHNEDAVDIRYYARLNGESLGLFVVADGLGGQDSGEVASQLAIETLWQAIRSDVWESFIDGETPGNEDLEVALRKAIKMANQQVYDARTERGSEMSTTLTLALVVNGMALIGNVGDSRAYAWSEQGLQQITQDHSLVQRLVDTGQITRDEIYTHPQRNIIYQSVGDRPQVRIDIFQQQIEPGETLVLCSDGLWEMVRDDGLEDVLLSESDPQMASERLVQNANLAGGEDNISIIIVQALS